MQPKKTKLALACGALCLGVSGASIADTFNLTVNTIGDVTILQEVQMDFGENITTDASGSCAMNIATPPAATLLTDTVLVFTGTNYGDLTGANCVGVLGTPGVYSITGEAGLDVTITLTDEVQAGGDYTFTPAGSAVIYDGGALGDTIGSLAVNTPTASVTLADVTGGDLGGVIDGETRFAVGGTIAVGATGLTSDTDYIATFNVNVIY